MSEYLLIENAVVGEKRGRLPRHRALRRLRAQRADGRSPPRGQPSEAGPGDKVVVFGAGPIRLGAAIWLKLRSVAHVVVVDVIPSRLEKAPAVGAEAVIDSFREDVTARA